MSDQHIQSRALLTGSVDELCRYVENITGAVRFVVEKSIDVSGSLRSGGDIIDTDSKQGLPDADLRAWESKSTVDEDSPGMDTRPIETLTFWEYRGGFCTVFGFSWP